MFQPGEDSDPPVKAGDFSFLLKGRCWMNHCWMRMGCGPLITTRPWTASGASAKSDREK